MMECNFGETMDTTYLATLLLSIARINEANNERACDEGDQYCIDKFIIDVDGITIVNWGVTHILTVLTVQKL